MKLNILFLSLAFCFASVNALEKPEGPAINPETARLEQAVDEIKAQGNLGPAATQARALETKRLADRVLELGMKQNKTPAEEQEFVLKRKELESHMKSLLPK
jgi:hypothetical protein